MKTYDYQTCCIESDGPSITAMNDAAQEISYATFLKHCNGVREWARAHHYDDRKDQGITLKGDWHVGYYKSTYQGQPCYFLRWSAIEFIWTQPTREQS